MLGISASNSFDECGTMVQSSDGYDNFFFFFLVKHGYDNSFKLTLGLMYIFPKVNLEHRYPL